MAAEREEPAAVPAIIALVGVTVVAGLMAYLLLGPGSPAREYVPASGSGVATAYTTILVWGPPVVAGLGLLGWWLLGGQR